MKKNTMTKVRVNWATFRTCPTHFRVSCMVCAYIIRCYLLLCFCFCTKSRTDPVEALYQTQQGCKVPHILHLSIHHTTTVRRCNSFKKPRCKVICTRNIFIQFSTTNLAVWTWWFFSFTRAARSFFNITTITQRWTSSCGSSAMQEKSPKVEVGERKWWSISTHFFFFSVIFLLLFCVWFQWKLWFFFCMYIFLNNCAPLTLNSTQKLFCLFSSCTLYLTIENSCHVHIPPIFHYNFKSLFPRLFLAHFCHVGFFSFNFLCHSDKTALDANCERARQFFSNWKSYFNSLDETFRVYTHFSLCSWGNFRSYDFFNTPRHQAKSLTRIIFSTCWECVDEQWPALTWGSILTFSVFVCVEPSWLGESRSLLQHISVILVCLQKERSKNVKILKIEFFFQYKINSVYFHNRICPRFHGFELSLLNTERNLFC